LQKIRRSRFKCFIFSKKTIVENIFHECKNLSKVSVNDINDGKQKIEDQINKDIDKEIKNIEVSNKEQKQKIY